MGVLTEGLHQREDIGRHNYITYTMVDTTLDLKKQSGESQVIFTAVGSPDHPLSVAVGEKVDPNIFIEITEDPDSSGATVKMVYLPVSTLTDPRPLEDIRALGTDDNTVMRRIQNESIVLSGKFVDRKRKRRILAVVITHA